MITAPNPSRPSQCARSLAPMWCKSAPCDSGSGGATLPSPAKTVRVPRERLSSSPSTRAKVNWFHMSSTTFPRPPSPLTLLPVIQNVTVPSPSAGAVQVMSHIRSDSAAEADVCVSDCISPCQLSAPVPPSSPLETRIENPAEYWPPAAGPPMMWSWSS